MHLDHCVEKPMLKAHTTEDYVFITGIITPQQVMDEFYRLKFDEESLNLQKNCLTDEIIRESPNFREFFFSFAWEGTNYEKSPLGIIEELNPITPDVMETFKQELLMKPVYFYTRDKGIETVENTSCITRQEKESLPFILPVPFTWRRDKVFRGVSYDIFYIDRDIEVFYLIERVLKLVNPSKHIQLSEKRKMSALILESGTCMPKQGDIEFLRKKVLEGINEDIESIGKHFRERAVNELESIYFYNKKWEERINELFGVTGTRLSQVFGSLSNDR